MNKLVLICLLFVIPTAFSQGTTAAPDCANPLLTKLGLTKLSSPTAQTDLSFCKSLEGAKLCCSADTVNSIQTPINELINSIIVKAAARDTWLLSLRTDTTNGLPSFTSALSTLQTTAKAALAIVEGTSGLTSSPKPTGDTLTQLEALEEALIPFTTLYDTVTSKVEDNWDNYQTTRATCMNALIKAQASIVCLACTSNYNSIGVNTDASAAALVNLDSAYQTSISAACAPFLNAAQTQNALVTAYTYRKQLSALNTNLAAITTSTVKTATDTVAKKFGDNLPETLTTDSQEPIGALTAACTTTSCADAYTTLWTQQAILNDDYAANGGKITVSASSSRLLGDSRTLTASANTYDPSSAANAAGVTVDFPEDAIAAASAFRQGGLITCLVALIAVFLF